MRLNQFPFLSLKHPQVLLQGFCFCLCVCLWGVGVCVGVCGVCVCAGGVCADKLLLASQQFTQKMWNCLLLKDIRHYNKRNHELRASNV